MQKIIVLFLLLAMGAKLSAKEYSVESPSAKIQIRVEVNESISYSVLLNGKEIIAPSPISMELDGDEIWGTAAKVKKIKTISVSQQLTPVVQRKYATITDEYEQLNLSFKGYALQFRAYDEGAAYRWVSEKAGEYKIVNEEATFVFPEDHNIWFPEEESIFSHQEREYLREKLSNIGAERFASTGMLVDCGNGVKTYISESNLMDYAGMFLRGCDENETALIGRFAGVVLEEKQLTDRDVKPTKYADYIAKCNGPREFPWRAILITENDADLVQSELIYKLGPEQKSKIRIGLNRGKLPGIGGMQTTFMELILNRE